MCKGTCRHNHCNCFSESDYPRGLTESVKNLTLEVARLKVKLNKCCGDDTQDVPSILDFKLNVEDMSIPSSTTLIINSATFTLINGQNVEPDSLKIYDLNTNTVIAENLSVISPVNFQSIEKIVYNNNTYTWKASVLGTDGVVYFSNDYTINVSDGTEPITANFFVGTTDMTPQDFQALTIPQIFELPNLQEKVIVGLGDKNFSFIQDKIIHYLLIPDNEVRLMSSEFGDSLITVLWNNSSLDGAYFPRNGEERIEDYQGKQYRLFFYYTPTVFSDPIKLVIKIREG